MELWILLGGFLVACIFILVVVNLLFFRGDHQKRKRKLEPLEERFEIASPIQEQAEEPVFRPVRVSAELELLSDILNEIEVGKGQEPDQSVEVNFAAVHKNFAVAKASSHLEQENLKKAAKLKQQLSQLPLAIQHWIEKELQDTRSMGWVLFKDEGILLSSDTFDIETREVFFSWKRLVEQTEGVLALSSLSQLELVGKEGRILMKRESHYTLFTLRENE